MTTALILIGGGGHCKSCIDVIEQEGKYEIFGILDEQNLIGQRVLDYKIIGSDENIYSLAESSHSFLITIGQIHTSKIRRNLFLKLRKCNANLATVISPLAYVSQHAVIGEGSIIMHHTLINAGAKIGENCIINSKALVEHDAVVGDHCHISTAAVINGGGLIREGTFFGSNAVCKENAVTGAKDFVNAGSLFRGEQ